MHPTTLLTQPSPSTIHSPATDVKHVLVYSAHVSLIATHTLLVSSNVQVLSQPLQLVNELVSSALAHDFTYGAQPPPLFSHLPASEDAGQ